MRSLLLLALMCFAGQISAAPLSVVTDIAPVHSLTQQVMGETGQAHLLLTKDMDPHSTALRPSQARALQEADLLVWVGPELTPWLERGLASLAAGATSIVLLDDEATILLETGEHDADDHDHSAHSHDPHAWLDPRNAQTWVKRIALALAQADPQNAEAYHANAKATIKDLQKLDAALAQNLAPAAGKPFVVLHDAYRYFEARFGLAKSASLTASDARPAGPARLSQLQKTLKDEGVSCIFAEPGLGHRMLATLADGQDIVLGELDPIGRSIPPGPKHYAQTLEALAGALVGCLAR